MITNTKFSYDDIKSIYSKEDDGKLKERMFIILNAYKMKSSYEIAGSVLTSHTKVLRWVNRFNRYGINGLRDKPKSGRPAKLNNEHKKRLQEILDQPREYSVGWRTIEVIDKIHKNFKIKYTQRHVRRILHNLGYSRIKPRPVHIRKNPIKAKEQAYKLKKNLHVWVKNGQFSQVMNSV